MQYLIKNKHWEINKEYNISTLLYLLIDRFDRIENDSFYVWYDSHTDLDHRDYDLPSLIYISDGDLHWNRYDIPYRINSNVDPAVIWGNGFKEWWVDGKEYKVKLAEE